LQDLVETLLLEGQPESRACPTGRLEQGRHLGRGGLVHIPRETGEQLFDFVEAIVDLPHHLLRRAALVLELGEGQPLRVERLPQRVPSLTPSVAQPADIGPRARSFQRSFRPHVGRQAGPCSILLRRQRALGLLDPLLHGRTDPSGSPQESRPEPDGDRQKQSGYRQPA